MFERTIERRHAIIAAEFAAWLEDIVAFDTSGEWQADGATSMSAWLAGRYGMARGSATGAGSSCARIARTAGDPLHTRA